MSSTTEDFDIVGSYNNQRVREIDAERSVNLFEYVDPLGKKPKILINTAGILNTNIIWDSETGGFRQQFFFLGFFYSVVGGTVFRTDSAFTTTVLGTITTATGYVGIDANTFQVIFVDGAKGYIWDTTAQTFTQITDTSFPTNPIDVCFLDGFFLVANGNTNTFGLSSLNQGLVWGPDTQTFTADDTGGNNWLILSTTANYQTGVPFQVSTSGALPNPLVAGVTYYAIHLDATHIRVATTYANAIAGTAITLTTNGTPTNTITSLGQLQQGAITSHPGTIVGCRTLHRRIFLFSQFFTEVWENAGIGTNLPFRRNNSLLMEYGTPALGSISVGFDKMFFLAQDRDGLGSVMEVAGTQSIPVSTKALDFTLSRYAADPLMGVADARGFLIKENGIIFYRLNFTKANHTFVYDVTFSDPSNEQTKFWHEEEILNGDRHPAQTHVYFNGVNYVGDYAKPILYEMDVDLFSNDGENIRRMRISRDIVDPGYHRRRIDRFQVDVQQGSIANLQQVFNELDLLTEDNFILETEDGNNILLDQSVIITQQNQLYIYLSISKDGGETFGYILKAPMGAVGQRTFRTLWRKLGTIPRGQGFVVKLEFFDAVPFIILGASWSFEILPE
jgi:WD40 repeat protein